MAARRSSESAFLIWLVVFIVIAFTAMATTVMFYNDSRTAKLSIANNQKQFADAVKQVFVQNGWELSEKNPDELGIRFDLQSYQQVAEKLNVAADYENAVLPLVGWDSIAGMQDALKTSPAQQQAADQGQSGFNTVRGLLGFYESAYTQQASDINDLRNQVAALSKQKDQLQSALSAREKELNQQINQLQQAHKAELDKRQKDYADLMASFDEQRRKTEEAQLKLQQEINARKADVSRLRDQIAALQEEVRQLTVPGEGLELTADGKVISVDGEFDVAFLEGGKDRGYEKNDTFVVYGLTPDGKERFKGLIKISEVSDTTSRASIVSEKEFILEGDYFVTTKQWDLFHPQQTAAAGGS